MVVELRIMNNATNNDSCDHVGVVRYENVFTRCRGSLF